MSSTNRDSTPSVNHHTAAPSPSHQQDNDDNNDNHHHSSASQQRSNTSHHTEYTVTENEEKLTEALREAADSRLMLVSRLEENAKQSAKQTEMIAQLISLTQQLSSMREKEAEYLEEIDKLKDEVAMLRNNSNNNQLQQNSSESETPTMSIEYNNNNTNNSEVISSTEEQIHIEMTRLRSENTALKTQCEFLAEEMKSTINLAASSQRRSAELSRIISHDATTTSTSQIINN